MKRVTLVILLFCGALLSQGCMGRREGEAPRVGANTSSETTSSNRGAIATLFHLGGGGTTVNLHKWDGTFSSGTLNSSAEASAQITAQILQGMSFKHGDPEKTASGAWRVTGSKEDQTTVLAILVPKGVLSSEIRVRIGTVGDRTGSERIVEEVQNATGHK